MLSSSYRLRSGTATARSILSGAFSRRLGGGGGKCQTRFSSSSSKEGTDALSLRRQAQEARQQRANQMHEEIAAITQKQEKRHAEEAEKKLKWKGFSEFLGKHKTNLSVIVVSFLTVVLSVKLVQGKHKYEDLEKELESHEAQAEEMRQLLRSIGSQEYLAQLANRCARELDNNNRSKRGSSWGATKTTQSTDDMSSTITNVLAQDIEAKIGDAALTEDEQSSKHLQQLTSQPKGDAAIEKLSALQPTPQSASNPATDEQQWVQGGDKNSKKKSVFVI
ncbi:expressed unknown protein [Seminavis robusta]|uniref:Uncharacterized protein n=1 Tax=Seminavis robusta TaxID=568900 RepID=A0A9N8HUF4_9STRA|nr:expressed unknown protein [Seminavis robusta]|eukprot:Sro1648_g288460.1 n/a (278) ;mRNA; r:7558-8590